MAALTGVTNTYRAPMKKNAKPKVDHHVKPIDPSVLMKQFSQTTVREANSMVPKPVREDGQPVFSVGVYRRVRDLPDSYEISLSLFFI